MTGLKSITSEIPKVRGLEPAGNEGSIRLLTAAPGICCRPD
jgi:hypothetical protein